jgi:poly(A) polymerase Pap1
MVKSWVKQLTRLKGYTDQMVEDANAVIVTFGSYRLGVSLLASMLDIRIFMLWFIFGELKPPSTF